MFNHIYRQRRVLVTGHTGFKGSWLMAWLHRLQADALGVSLPAPADQPCHLDLLALPGAKSAIVDIRDLAALRNVIRAFDPEIVFHLAAQPLVRLSYQIPIETLATNVMGTAHVLEACRKAPSLRAIVAITSDKCYENSEREEPYNEQDPVGGYDPYSVSKGCSELIISAWRRSFFHPDDLGLSHHVLLASARAGNVVGGGDWAADRLIPDLVRAAAAGKPAVIRNPQAIRPWQHVLEPLAGYLLLGQKLHERQIACATAWNFGPDADGMVAVQTAAEHLARHWPDIQLTTAAAATAKAPHEANILRLDCTKAKNELQWRPVWNPDQTFRHTACWYRDFYAKGKINTFADLDEYISDASNLNLPWTKD
ncbi:MAG: CDP-glucose 4,6-dehydratase [Lentisphaeria bacterium]|jgi:CDP-glucose 4,6-dehydratase